jgi:hypothetical protein
MIKRKKKGISGFQLIAETLDLSAVRIGLLKAILKKPADKPIRKRSKRHP